MRLLYVGTNGKTMLKQWVQTRKPSDEGQAHAGKRISRAVQAFNLLTYVD
jgi:hypothetical protein